MEGKDFLTDRFSDQDPFDQEERCRKALRTLLKALLARICAGILLLAAVIRTGAAPVALGLTAFVLIIIVLGAIPLAQELKKQYALLRESRLAQENTP